MGKYTHPAHGLPDDHIEAFERIAIGQTKGIPLHIEARLKREGLIKVTGMYVVSRAAFGPIKLPVYEVPLPIHIQWCAWCAENVSDEELD